MLTSNFIFTFLTDDINHISLMDFQETRLSFFSSSSKRYCKEDLASPINICWEYDDWSGRYSAIEVIYYKCGLAFY